MRVLRHLYAVVNFEKCTHKLDCAVRELGTAESKQGEGVRMAVRFPVATSLGCGWE